MTYRRCLFVIGLWSFIPAERAFAAVALLDGITVRLYDSAGVDAKAKETALSVAARTLAVASVGVNWQPCESGARSKRCETPAAAGELAVRFVRAPAPAGSGRQLPLGDAFVDTGARAGVLATIYVDRVMVMATMSGADAATLLGRAIAHELGHLLLATSEHGTRGLMRAVWSGDELRRERAADWTFTAAEIAAIRETGRMANSQLPTSNSQTPKDVGSWRLGVGR